MRLSRSSPALLLLVSAGALAASARADEGMWLLQDFPFAQVERAYQAKVESGLLERLRGAAVRLSSGGSGAFVSPQGLVLTNQHVVVSCLEASSSPESDLVLDGFVAATPAEEIPCRGLELDVLVSIESVTERVRRFDSLFADAPGVAGARRQEIAAIERECSERTRDRCDVVSLFHGARLDLYRYRHESDLRLVYVPPAGLAAPGAGEDDYEWPRWALDFALLRLWRGGAPAETATFLPLSASGPRPGEVTLLVGSPGSTARAQTVAQLLFQRDAIYPLQLASLESARAVASAIAERGAEERRAVASEIAAIDNSAKAAAGFLAALRDPRLMAKKESDEQALRARLGADPRTASATEAFPEIGRTLDLFRPIYPRYEAVELRLAQAGRLAGLARRIVRLVGERERPPAERLADYRDANLAVAAERLLAPVAVRLDQEERALAAVLRHVTLQLGPNHPVVRSLFAERTPEALAAEAIAGTGLANAEKRKKLLAGSFHDLATVKDPLLRLMLAVEPEARELRRRVEVEIETPQRAATARLAEARQRLELDLYPDANWTPRVSFGTAAGYVRDGEAMPVSTEVAGLVARLGRLVEIAGPSDPRRLASALATVKSRLAPPTSVAFLSTHDFAGGSSGSPLVDLAGSVVGVVYDGNLESLANRFLYDGERARAISVDSRAITATLRLLEPRAAPLAAELAAAARAANR